MKKQSSFVLMCALLFAALLVSVAAAGGDGNIDGGGDGTGTGNAESHWNGEDGVRVTLLQGRTPTTILDYSNQVQRQVQTSFTRRCKLAYRNDQTLYPVFELYQNFVPTTPLPRIIGNHGSNNITAIKRYFTSEYMIRNIAADAGIAYDTLVDGSYRLMLEPISYFKYKGIHYAMTATEAALYDVQVAGQLSYWMGTLTHQNQPFAMFLERPDLGIAPWTGATTGKQANIDILQSLGVGIVSFTPEHIDPPLPTGDYAYHTGTDVITSVGVTPGRDITPDDNAFVTFTILGRTYSKQFVCPGGSSQVVWVRWHTPDAAQTVPIRVEGPGISTTLQAAVTELANVEPPDPIYDGPGIGGGQYIPNFRLAEEPNWGSQTAATWSEWVPVWHPPQVVGSIKHPITIPGYWTFNVAEYQAALFVHYKLVPDERVPTAFKRSANRYEMKSGYGVNAQCEVQVSGAGGVSNYDVAPVQNAVAVFPEFGYRDYNRVLQPKRAGSYQTDWGFPENQYSYYLQPAHFTPLWYPDGMRYTVPLAVFDAWTPGGQLYATVSDYIEIDGAMLDDWYIRVLSD